MAKAGEEKPTKPVKITWIKRGGYNGFAGVAPSPNHDNLVIVDRGGFAEVSPEQLAYLKEHFQGCFAEGEKKLATEDDVVDAETTEAPPIV